LSKETIIFNQRSFIWNIVLVGSGEENEKSLCRRTCTLKLKKDLERLTQHEMIV